MKCGPVSALRFSVNPKKALGLHFDPNFEYKITRPDSDRHNQRIAEGFEVICELVTSNAERLVVIGKPKGTK